MLPRSCSLCLLGAVISVQAATGIPGCTDAKTTYAEVVALEQVYVWNRYDAFNPAGMMYALRHDVVHSGGGALKEGKTEGQSRQALEPGNVRLRGGKRPRPIVLRVREGECLHVLFENLLTPAPPGPDEQSRRNVPEHFLTQPGSPQAGSQRMRDALFSADYPRTRAASLHINGLDYLDISADAANAGRNRSSLALPKPPGETGGCSYSSSKRHSQCREYRFFARKEGTYFLYSQGAPLGGEGDGGQLGLGLFGAVIVEPSGSTAYRSQVNHTDIKNSLGNQIPKADYSHYAKIDYSRFRMEEVIGGRRMLRHSDLNAIIQTDPNRQYVKDCLASNDGDPATNPSNDPVTGRPRAHPFGSSCGRSFREFTTIFHDEIKAIQAFPELEVNEESDEHNPYASVKDGMAINYGSSGMGAMYAANRRKIGPNKDCPECLYEEFFLTSWANGDPALVVERDSKTGKPLRAKYPDDPSNVHHSYLGDPVVFRAIHAGPKETHVFHLHAHQWLLNRDDPNSHYLDSQTIGPGSAFTYEIWYGGSGNRNFTPGDSIFHCHLYPHFAQGMWELWRVHDVFEDGKPGVWYNPDPKRQKGGSDPTVRNLPDAEIDNGTANVALLPIPGLPLAPPPTADFPGYPFYIAADVGHRPPQPPNDFEKDLSGTGFTDGGLPRHTVRSGEHTPIEPELIKKGGPVVELTARRVLAQTGTPREQDFKNSKYVKDMKSWAKLDLKFYAPEGEPWEKNAMKFHAGTLRPSVAATTAYDWKARGYARPLAGGKASGHPWDQKYFLVNGQGPAQGAPYANPCPADTVDNRRFYDAAYIQFGMTVNRYGWHDPQARITLLTGDIKSVLDKTKLPEPFFFRAKSNECIEYHITNLIPNALNVDDFQIYSPTDTIGQHIHLVKFDVTSADGSGNGWNYEDSTYSPDEVQERIKAYNKLKKQNILTARTHRLFGPKGPMRGDPRGLCPNGEWCGAQTTVQRWWADPLFTQRPQDLGAGDSWRKTDKTIRTVFTHDHMGPSSHQHHGMYAALVVEPAGSEWKDLPQNLTRLSAPPTRKAFDPSCDAAAERCDGGPTSFMANIHVPEPRPEWVKPDFREYNLAFGDFAIVYTRDLLPVNRPNKNESDLFWGHAPGFNAPPRPEAISTEDPGTQLLNYRNEPIPLRITDSRNYNGVDNHRQRPETDPRGDMSNVFSSRVHAPLTSELNGPLASPRIDGVFALTGKPQQDLQAIFDTLEADRRKFVTVLEQEPLRRPGDPSTPVLPVLAGDRAQIRLIQGSQEEQHTFTVNGLTWPEYTEVPRPRQGFVNAQPLGISEHFEFDIDVKAPTGIRARFQGQDLKIVDHLISSSSTENLWDGQWAILRKQWEESGIRSIRAQVPKLLETGNTAESGVCPASAPKKQAFVRAFRACDLLGNCGNIASGVVYNQWFGLYDPQAIVFVEEPPSLKTSGLSDQQRVAKLKDMYRSGKPLEPLTLRVRSGDCLSVDLQSELGSPVTETLSYNYMPPIVEGLNFNQVRMSNSIGLHAQLVSRDTFFSDGAAVGYNAPSLALPGEAAQTYVWYAGDEEVNDGKLLHSPRELGAAALRPYGDAIKHSSHGAVGALIVEPEGSSWQSVYPDGSPCTPTGQVDDPCDYLSRLTAKVTFGNRSFYEFTAVIQDDLSLQKQGQPLPNLRMGEDSEDSGAKGLNYRTNPIWARNGIGSPAVGLSDSNKAEFCDVFSTSSKHCEGGAKPAKEDKPVENIFSVPAGEEVRIRVVHPGGHQRQHGVTIAGHQFNMSPRTPQKAAESPSYRIAHEDTITGLQGGLGPARHLNLIVRAGGVCGVPGDYIVKSQPSFLLDGGVWGIMRVTGAPNPGSECPVTQGAK